MKFVDAHGHLSFPAYDESRQEVVGRAKASGVSFVVAVGTQSETSLKAVEFAKANPGWAYATVGMHPAHVVPCGHLDKNELLENSKNFEFSKNGENFDTQYYLELLKNPEVVAVGECGLDYYRISEDGQKIKDAQKDIFLRQMELSKKSGKTLMIHCRSAAEDFLEIVSSNKNMLLSDNPGIMHFYTDSTAVASKLLDLGFYFTFGGVITFSRDYDDLVRLIPRDRILTETDCPYVAPAPHRGKINEPSFIPFILKKLAEIRGVEEEFFSEEVIKNFRRVFRID